MRESKSVPRAPQVGPPRDPADGHFQSGLIRECLRRRRKLAGRWKTLLQRRVNGIKAPAAANDGSAAHFWLICEPGRRQCSKDRRRLPTERGK
jgi:hypothetical protein